MADDNEELVSVVRRQNVALRKVNKILRKRIVQLEEHGDTVFLELCKNEIVTEGLPEEAP